MRKTLCVLGVLPLATAAAFAAPVKFDPHAVGPQGNTWASIAKLPDWSGAWALDPQSFRKVLAVSGGPETSPYMPPLNAKYLAQRRENGAKNGGQGNAGTGVITNSVHCLIDGMPGVMSEPFSFEYLYTPGRVTIINDGREVRRVYTDGRGHNPNADPTFEGDSIGHWEGKTLVIDTTNMLPKAQLFVGINADSDQMHITERLSQLDKNTMQDQLSVTDPAVFTKPWVYVRTYARNPLGMTEYVCEQNNRDANGPVDLTPPP